MKVRAEMEEGAAAAEMEEDQDKMEMEEETTLIEERRQGGGLESLWEWKVYSSGKS